MTKTPPPSAIPKVSVIVPCYNHARFLKRRLQSIVDQTCQDFELILLDDASVDGSRQLLQEFAKTRPARVILNEQNTGSAFKQWNRGAREAQGDYLWIAESDDYAAPRFLERLVAVMEGNPSVGLAYCDSWTVDEHEAVLGTWGAEYGRTVHPTRWQNDYAAKGERECVSCLLSRCTIPNASAALFRREAYQRAAGAEEGLRLCGDWLTYVKILLLSDVAYLAEPLNYFRYHSQSVRSTTSVKQGLEEAYAVRAYICRKLGPNSSERRRAARMGWREWYGALGSLYLGEKKRFDWPWMGRVLRQAMVLDCWVLFRLAKGLVQIKTRNSRLLGPSYWWANRLLKGAGPARGG